MRIIFLNRYFHPDHSATSQMLSDLAFGLAGRGLDVHVIASRQRYDDARAALPGAECIDGVGMPVAPFHGCCSTRIRERERLAVAKRSAWHW